MAHGLALRNYVLFPLRNHATMSYAPLFPLSTPSSQLPPSC